MKNFKVTIEETVAEDFEVEAASGEEALEIAKARYLKREFVLTPGEVQSRKISIAGKEWENL